MRPLILTLLIFSLCFPAHSVAAPLDTQAAPIRIMPLGDSITEGDDGSASYRYWLWHKLKRAGYEVDFVGSQKGVLRGTPRFLDFDQDHEGHWAWTASQVAKNIDAWAKLNPADVVLIHLGSNDVSPNGGIPEAIAALEQIISVLRKHNPSVKILLAKIIPYQNGFKEIELFNDEVGKLAKRLATSTSLVKVVDQFSGFDVANDTYDGLHPNENGEKKMAERWMLGVRTLLSAGS